MRRAPRTATAILQAAFLWSLSLPSDASAAADYRDVSETEAYLESIDGALGGRIRVHQIGTGSEGTPIYAVQIGEVGPQGVQVPDSAAKPALLIECGTHAREWASAEMCLRFIDGVQLAYGLDLLARPETGIREAMEQVTVWVVPMVNPEGRKVDDKRGGNPLFYGEGSGWRRTNQAFDCPADLNACGPWPEEMEPTAPVGVKPGERPPPPEPELVTRRGFDLNRQYSNDFKVDECDCSSSSYQGQYPFQSKEARIMRQFVNNRMISSSLTVHSFQGGAGMVLAGVGRLETVLEHFRSEWNRVAVPEFTLDRRGGGSGSGQFTSWLSKVSDSAAADGGTLRGIVSMLIELPPKQDVYDASGYRYRDRDGDSSNAFHPSGEGFLEDLARPNQAALMYLMRQARSPWRPINPATLTADLSPGCKNSGTAGFNSGCLVDFGLTGSKIAVRASAVGALEGVDTGDDPRETLKAGEYGVVYRVQNFSESGAAREVEVEVTIESKRPGTRGGFKEVGTFVHKYKLASLQGAAGWARRSLHTYVPNQEYRVTIEILGDDEISENDKHLFRFEVVP